MFKKKKCPRCGESLSDKYSFCPSCGSDLNSKRKNQNWGMLGENDFTPFREEIKLPAGFNTLFNSLMKNLDSQFKNIENELQTSNNPPKVKKSGISINISTSGNNPPKIRVRQFGESPKGNVKGSQKEEAPKLEYSFPELSRDKIKKATSLPKKEPTTNVRRFSDKVVYEINIPGVKSIKDVSIRKLENSIEIKALTDKQVYIKIIPINLPITDYNLSKGKLVLELDNQD